MFAKFIIVPHSLSTVLCMWDANALGVAGVWLLAKQINFLNYPLRRLSVLKMYI